jgi:hypothetical protein
MVMPIKWVPNAAAMLGNIPREIPRKFQEKSHDAYFGFCPAKSQLYRFVVKPVAGQIP